MSKKGVLSFALQTILKEFEPKVPEDKKQDVEDKAEDKLSKILGKNWATLPITGPRMMVLTLVLNYVLLPYGITPSSVADNVIEKGEEYGLDEKFNRILKDAKEMASSTGEFTSETLAKMSLYAEEKGKVIGDSVKEVLAEPLHGLMETLNSGMSKSKGALESGVNKGRNVIGKGIDKGKELLGSNKNNNETEE